VLRDDDGHFAALKRRFRAWRPEIRRLILDTTVRAVLTLLQRSHEPEPLVRLMSLRELAWKLGCLIIYEKSGLRVPKLRHLRERLPAPLLKAVRSALGLELTARQLREIESVASTLDERLTRFHREHLGKPDARIARDTSALSKLAAGATDEGILKLRATLDGALLGAIGGDRFAAVSLVAKKDPELFEAFRIVHALPAQPAALSRKAELARKEVRRLFNARGMERLLSPRRYLAAPR
jgi:hypothetical protein